MKVVDISRSFALDVLRECVPVWTCCATAARDTHLFAYLCHSIVKDQLTADAVFSVPLLRQAREKLCKCSRRKSVDHFTVE